MSQRPLALILLGALVLVGAGCASRGSQKTTTEQESPAGTPSAQQEEVPELTEDSSPEDVEEVVNDIDSKSSDVNGMSTSIESVESVNAEL